MLFAFNRYHKLVAGLSVCAVLALATMSAGQSQAAAPGCLDALEATSAVKKTEQLAELDAIARWISAVDRKKAGYSSWHRADEVRMKCFEATPGLYRCKLRATPCSD